MNAAIGRIHATKLASAVAWMALFRRIWLI